MLRPKDFWAQIDPSSGGALLVAVLESWKEVSERVGVPGVVLAEAAFHAVAEVTMGGAMLAGQLSPTAAGSWWTDRSGPGRALNTLNRLTPLNIIAGSETIRVRIWTATIAPARDATTRELFERTVAEVDDHMATLPNGVQHRPMYRNWEQTTELAAAPTREP